MCSGPGAGEGGPEAGAGVPAAEARRGVVPGTGSASNGSKYHLSTPWFLAGILTNFFSFRKIKEENPDGEKVKTENVRNFLLSFF